MPSRSSGHDRVSGPGSREEPLNEPIAQRAYYSIGEVCDLTGIQAHVLRYWETRFELLRPVKNQAGNRVYRPREVELVLLLKRLLYEDKYTVEGARQELARMRRTGGLQEARKAALAPELRGQLKSDLAELMDILSVPGQTGDS
ncbi:MAG: MerR family transcriptional regulator [Gammaproteobacteria bacterium]|nr:MerR family transcriptional regulator [Gammaproteobacteria bacterium]MYF61432.1 MerR family transcriptional regulator [Gammaproteobacteria bacterium]MYI21231.1 MerR family transcriptional regulator [Gammaproteobacteria bacterium]